MRTVWPTAGAFLMALNAFAVGQPSAGDEAFFRPHVVLKDPTIEGETWWSLQPLARPPIPEVKNAAWVRNPVDAFILSRLEKETMSPSPEADRRTLIRRLYYDLLGLPPPIEEIDAFLRDAKTQAYENLVDRLLASPHYGERWARHWLDVVHYGDTHGYDKDKVRPNAWPYRDYVIRAFNEDKPYSRFVEEQVAGDVLYPDTRDGIVALGFLAAGPWDFVGQVELREGTLDKKITRNLDRDDMVTTAMNTFISTTVQCARCHDHKFDPIKQEEYYGLQAVFAGIDRANRPYEANPKVETERRRLRDRQGELLTRKQSLDSRIKHLAGPAHIAASVLRRQNTEIEAELKRIAIGLAALPPEKLVFASVTHFSAEGSFTPTRGKARPIYFLRRGSEKDPTKLVGPGAIHCLASLGVQFPSADNQSEGQRRVALARWITDSRNALTWRSIVNRVWQYHIGQGIVATPNDFGRMGASPSHPELLDWLATRLRDQGQSLKQLHRLIVTSATYRQTSAHNAEYSRIDGGNRLLWRMNRRRLDAESIRDAVLAVSGRLDKKMYGPGFRAFGFRDDHSPHYKYEEYDPDEPTAQRRSIYRFIVRSVPDPFMETLDCADPSLNVARRNETLTALQALALLNNKFMVRMTEHFAARAERMGDDLPTRVTAAYRLALARSPASDELELLVSHARKFGLASACRLIVNTNEFHFVD